jgi:hypothetical protein
MKSFSRKIASASVAAIAIAVATQASATPIVDQSQTLSSGSWSPINIDWLKFSQSFTAGYNNSVGGGFLLDTSGPVTQGAVTIFLSTGPLGTSGSTVLASQTAEGTAGNWVDVSWNRIDLTIGQTYYLGLTSPSELYVAYGGNNYANGSIYGSNSHNYLPEYYDLTFRTYADDANAVPVPEPETCALMLAGLAALGFVTRRRVSSKAA